MYIRFWSVLNNFDNFVSFDLEINVAYFHSKIAHATLNVCTTHYLVGIRNTTLTVINVIT